MKKTIEERFWNKVKKTNTCWVWMARKDYQGYGQLLDTSTRIPRQAHRVSWKIHNGDIPDKLYVCHTCDNPSCVNPNHLFLGTAKDNTDDRDKKGRNILPWMSKS